MKAHAQGACGLWHETSLPESHERKMTLEMDEKNKLNEWLKVFGVFFFLAHQTLVWNGLLLSLCGGGSGVQPV